MKHRIRVASTFILFASFATFTISSANQDRTLQTATADDPPPKWGHSRHGSAYDEGPRSKPWIMPGIGETHFPVTSSHPEVQKWFDQGHTLLHGFWFFEAERAFRWCLKLDPDCAMAYWGLARCTEMYPTRAQTFLKEALDRKDRVTDRERAYLEVWEAKAAVSNAGMDEEIKTQAIKHYASLFDKLLIDYPEDMEARTLYWLELPRLLGDGNPEAGLPSRYAMEMVLQAVLKVDPEHVGALHYRIHNWDTSNGRFALDSCLLLSRLAPESGHLQHMPGHVLSGAGLWHEAAIAMDAATRVEKRYMKQRMILPKQNWNYGHNLDYLCFIQEQLGMYDAALLNVQQLLAGPDEATQFGFPGGFKITALRLFVKYEKWDEILAENSTLLRWDEKSPFEQFLNNYAMARAYLGINKLDKARTIITQLRKGGENQHQGPPVGATAGENADAADKKGPGPPADFIAKMMEEFRESKILELEALEKLAAGEYLEGLKELTRAAKLQAEKWRNDPPMETLLYNTLGDTYLKLNSPLLAIAAFEESLKIVTNDGFALAGLVQTHHAVGDTKKAREAMANLKVVWSDADPDNRWLQAALNTGIDADPELDSPIPQRNYKSEVLDVLGPSLWIPAKAPQLLAIDSSGQAKSLDDFAGKNVILIFYQGGECLHCMEQLQMANELADELKELDTVMVAVSKDEPSLIKEYEASTDVKIEVLSDVEFASAKRFKSYDDFEGIELHTTLLINKRGQVHWLQRGGEPFMNFDFLKAEVRRLQASDESVTAR